MHASPFVTPSEAAVLPACSLYNHPRGSPGSRSITRECCRSALAWKGVGSPGASSGAPLRTRCQYRTEARGDEGGLTRLAGGLVSRGPRPRSSRDESLDGHARAPRDGNVDCEARSPCSLSPLPYCHLRPRAARRSPVHLLGKPGFFLSVVSSVRCLFLALLLISLYLLTSPLVESSLFIKTCVTNRKR